MAVKTYPVTSGSSLGQLISVSQILNINGNNGPITYNDGSNNGSNYAVGRFSFTPVSGAVELAFEIANSGLAGGGVQMFLGTSPSATDLGLLVGGFYNGYCSFSSWTKLSNLSPGVSKTVYVTLTSASGANGVLINLCAKVRSA